MKPSLTLVVTVPDQRLRVFRGAERLREFIVSTAARGTGCEANSYRTPTGRFRICEVIGDGMPAGTIFRARVPVGLWRDGDPPGDDLILGRILRLDGLEPENANTLERCIYIHGTNQEKLLGQPCSHGCVRLARADMVELFGMVSPGDTVWIMDFSSGRTRRPMRRKAPHAAGEGRKPDIRNAGRGTIDDKFVLADGLPDHIFKLVMSTKSNKAAPTGVRYSDAQKKEIVDFVAKYNSDNGRGGQSAASKKYKVTQLTISGWLKAAGVKSKGEAKSKAKASKKAVKAAKAAASAPAPSLVKPAPAKPSASSKKGMRYPVEYKQEVIDFVNSYNATNGRGGQSRAAKKYNLSVLTVSSWLKSGGVKGGALRGGIAKVAAAAPAVLNSRIRSLIELGDELRKAENEASRLRVKYDAMRSSIQSLL